MKTHFYFLLFSLVATLLSAQTWQKQYDHNNGNTDFAFKIIETSKNHFILCGATTVPDWYGYGFDGYVLAINYNGDTLWTKTIGSMGFGAQNDFLFDVIENNNNDLVFTGSRKQGLQKSQLWFVKFQLNSNGTQIINVIEKQYGGLDKEDGGSKIIENADGTLFILGSTESKGTQQGGKDAWLLKLNSNGDTIWTKTYDFGFEENGGGIIPFQNGNYLMIINSITGYITNPVPYYPSFSTCIVIDSVGNILKSLTFDTDTINSFHSIKATSDGGAVIVGATSMFDVNSARDIFVVKLNSNADTVWTKTYGKYQRWDGGLDIIQTADQTYYLTAYSQSHINSSFDDWWLMRLNSNGDTLYTKWIILPDNDDPLSIIQANDGSIVVAGWINANSNPFQGLNIGNSNVYVVKMDTNFFASFNKKPLEKQSVMIFPNPFSTDAKIFSNKPFNNATLIIYNLYGQTVKQINNISGQYFNLYRENLSNGLYFIQLTDENKVLISIKIIIVDE